MTLIQSGKEPLDLPGEPLQVDMGLRGGLGPDLFNVTLVVPDLTQGTPDLLARVNVSGGQGNDRINFASLGQSDGSLRARLDGGEGNDIIDVLVDVDPNSTALLAVIALGGDGNDRLRLNAQDSRDSGGRYRVDGGDGYDFGLITEPVIDTTCEGVTFIPVVE